MTEVSWWFLLMVANTRGHCLFLYFMKEKALCPSMAASHWSSNTDCDAKIGTSLTLKAYFLVVACLTSWANKKHQHCHPQTCKISANSSETTWQKNRYKLHHHLPFCNTQESHLLNYPLHHMDKVYFLDTQWQSLLTTSSHKQDAKYNWAGDINTYTRGSKLEVPLFLAITALGEHASCSERKPLFITLGFYLFAFTSIKITLLERKEKQHTVGEKGFL